MYDFFSKQSGAFNIHFILCNMHVDRNIFCCQYILYGLRNIFITVDVWFEIYTLKMVWMTDF